jgi:hypothetical protein
MTKQLWVRKQKQVWVKKDKPQVPQSQLDVWSALLASLPIIKTDSSKVKNKRLRSHKMIFLEENGMFCFKCKFCDKVNEVMDYEDMLGHGDEGIFYRCENCGSHECEECGKYLVKPSVDLCKKCNDLES